MSRLVTDLQSPVHPHLPLARQAGNGQILVLHRLQNALCDHVAIDEPHIAFALESVHNEFERAIVRSVNADARVELAIRQFIEARRIAGQLARQIRAIRRAGKHGIGQVIRICDRGRHSRPEQCLREVALRAVRRGGRC